MTRTRSDSETTGLLRAALRVKYEDRIRYALLEEVANGTGFTGRGWADAVLLELWPSDGLRLLGFEIKASRSDWKRELKDLRKAENIARFCDGWIIVAPKGVVPLDTVPEAWGLWEYDLEKESWSYRKAYAPRTQPKYIPRRFFAALLRRAQDSFPSPQYVAHAVRHAVEQTKRYMSQERATDLRLLKSQLDVARSEANEMAAVLKAEGYVRRYSGWQRAARDEAA